MHCLLFLLSLLPADWSRMDFCGLASQSSKNPKASFLTVNKKPQTNHKAIIPVYRDKPLLYAIGSKWDMVTVLYTEKSVALGYNQWQMNQDYSADLSVVYSY